MSSHSEIIRQLMFRAITSERNGLLEVSKIKEALEIIFTPEEIESGVTGVTGVKERIPHPVSLSVLPDTAGEIITLEELEVIYIKKCLELLHGNHAEVARVLGISRSTLYRKVNDDGDHRAS